MALLKLFIERQTICILDISPKTLEDSCSSAKITVTTQTRNTGFEIGIPCNWSKLGMCALVSECVLSSN